MKPALVVLAGGMGSRYGGLKQLDGVGPLQETIVDYSVYDAIRAGFGKVVLVVQESIAAEFKSKVSSHFEDLIEVIYAFQPMQPDIPGIGVVARQKPWGTGHALLAAKDVVHEPFAVINADDYYGISSFRLMSEFLLQRVSAECFAMVGFQLAKTLSSNGSVSRGICAADQSGNLVSVLERTSIEAKADGIYDQSEQPPVPLSGEDLVSMNFWGFDVSFFEQLEVQFIEFAKKNVAKPKSEFYIPTIVNNLLGKGTATVEVLSSNEQWYGVTYVEDKPAVQRAIKKMIEQQRYKSPLWKR